MKTITLFRDFLFGGLIVSIFSYLTSMYEDTPYLFKIGTYLWGAPLIYFYLLYIVWGIGETAVKGFLIHAIMGVSVTLFSILITLYIYKIGRNTTVIINFLILFVVIFVYLKYKVYLLY